MKNTMTYRGYTGTVEFSEVDAVFFGQVAGIRSLVSYEGTTATGLLTDFHQAVDDYLAACEEQGIAPEVPYKGSFNVRIKPSLHERVATIALQCGKSLNACVAEALEQYVAAF